MQFLKAGESRAWAARRGFSIDASFGHPIASDLAAPVWFNIPSDAGARVALARMLWETVGQTAPEVLVWVTEWGVWPSGECPPLVTAARRGLGAQQDLAESPGHLVRLGETHAGLAIFTLAILSLWDCWVLSTNQAALFVSHDEYGAADSRTDDEELRRRLRLLGHLRAEAPAI